MSIYSKMTQTLCYGIEYVFYKIYSINSKTTQEWDRAGIAWLSLSCLLMLNVVSIIALLDFLFNTKLISQTNKYLILISACFLILVPLFLKFVYKNRFKEIKLMFSEKSRTDKIKGNIIVILYASLFCLLIILFSLLKKYKIHL
jgi:hypothetical protein